jgi:hypothetical protein
MTITDPSKAGKVRVVIVEPWEIDAAITGWGIIRCPHCKQILRPLEPTSQCSDGYTHDLRDDGDDIANDN